MRRVLARLVADGVMVASLLFLAAGTFAWWRAWALLTVLLVIRVLGALVVYRINPVLMRDRAGLPIHADQSQADRLLLLGILASGYLGLPIIAGLDVFRWRLLPSPAPMVAAIGLLSFAIGWILKSLTLGANAFAVAVVRVRREGAQTVADTGPYAVVRHPFYAADPLILVGLGLWLQSSVAALCAVVPIALMVMRLGLEERVLRRELPGYTEYASRVRFRLIPGVW